jgi:hypothetical protein
VSGITSQAEVSVIPVTCASCGGVIGSAEKFVRHTDRRTPQVVRFAECAPCARRAGRGPLLERPPA